MLTRLKTLTGLVGIDKLLMIVVVIACSGVAAISFITGQQETPIAKMSEEIIEDVVEAETGVKLDINNYEPKADVSAK